MNTRESYFSGNSGNEKDHHVHTASLLHQARCGPDFHGGPSRNIVILSKTSEISPINQMQSSYMTSSESAAPLFAELQGRSRNVATIGRSPHTQVVNQNKMNNIFKTSIDSLHQRSVQNPFQTDQRAAEGHYQTVQAGGMPKGRYDECIYNSETVK